MRLGWIALAPAQSLLLKRAQFDEAIGHLCGSVEDTVLRLLRDAGVAPSRRHRVLHGRLQRRAPAARKDRGAGAGTRKVEGDLFGSIGAGLALDAVRSS